MLDTLMALWNQDRRKRAGQVILTFLLMCIGISLLFVITNRSVESQHQHQQSLVGHANPTVPTFGNTVVPDLTPTVSVVVGAQRTPAIASTQPTPVATTVTQPTPGTSGNTGTQPTPAATTGTQPCVATPAGATSQESSLYTDTLLRQGLSPTPTPHHGSSPIKHFDGGGGGGPIDTGTPVLTTPTPMPQSTPASPNSQPGWVPNCTTSNSIGVLATNYVLPLLLQNMWLILASSLLGTIIFYSTLFAIKRRMRV